MTKNVNFRAVLSGCRREDAAQALAALLSTGCVRGVLLAEETQRIHHAMGLAVRCDVGRVGELASRGSALAPALLASLCARGPEGLAVVRSVFAAVITDGGQLGMFIRCVGVSRAGSSSLGSGPKRMVRRWLQARSPEALFQAFIRYDEVITHAIRVAHPRPQSPEQRAMYGYLVHKPYDILGLPPNAQRFAYWSRGETLGAVPNVPLRWLALLSLTPEQWRASLRKATWSEIFHSLSALRRGGVLAEPEHRTAIAARLSDPAGVCASGVSIWTLLIAWRNSADLPAQIADALLEALHLVMGRQPRIGGRVVVCVDVSGSMGNAVAPQSPRLRWVDVAAGLVSVLRQNNPDMVVVAFDRQVYDLALSPLATLPQIVERLMQVGGGTANAAAPLRLLNACNAEVDLVLCVSDADSWIDTVGKNRGRGFDILQEWHRIERRCPRAKLVNINLDASAARRVGQHAGILHVQGFSDAVLPAIVRFCGADGDP